MEKIDGRWMHDGKEHEVVEGDCKTCVFYAAEDCSIGFDESCYCAITESKCFKLKENQDMIRPFKCAAMTPERVVKMRKALSRHGIEIHVEDDASYVFYRPGEDMEWASDALTPEEFVDCEEEEMTFDQAMEMILAAPVLKKEPVFDIKLRDEVLCRDTLAGTWEIKVFARIGECHSFQTFGTYYSQMLPFKGNEHLHGTTDTPDGWWECKDGKPVWVTQ